MPRHPYSKKVSIDHICVDLLISYLKFEALSCLSGLLLTPRHHQHFNELNRSINDTGTNFPSPQPLQLPQSCSITPSSGLHSSSIYHRPYLLNRPTAFRQQGIHLSAGRRTAVKRPTYRGGYKSRQETWS